MGRLNGPLFSLAASGSIASTLTYSRWRGIPYVRQRVVPNNPNTTDQQEIRNAFGTLQDLYVITPAMSLASWDEAARGRPYTGRNRFTQLNVAAFRTNVDLSDAILIAPRGSVPFPSGVTISSPGAGLLRAISATPPTVTGLTFFRALLSATEALTPTEAPPYTWVEDDDTAAPIQCDITGLVADTYHCCFAWQYTDGFGFVHTSGNIMADQAVA